MCLCTVEKKSSSTSHIWVVTVVSFVLDRIDNVVNCTLATQFHEVVPCKSSTIIALQVSRRYACSFYKA